jgi:hypothetical protein
LRLAQRGRSFMKWGVFELEHNFSFRKNLRSNFV